MKRVFLAATTMLCALTIALVGCSGGAATNATEDNYKGFWALEDESLGFMAGLSLEDESFAGLLVSDSYFEGTWAMDGSNVKITFEDAGAAEPVNVHLDGDKLILGSDQGSRLVFKKSSEDEFYEDIDASGGELSGASSEEATFAEDVEIVEEKIDSIQPVSVADDSVVKIEVTGKGTDFTADPGYRLSITNKSNKSFFIGANGLFKVNGKELEAGLGDVIDAGETVETFMYFSKDELGGSVEALKGVEGTIVVFDEETEKELGSYPFKMS